MIEVNGKIIERALIVREPWIGLILSGRKTWEMRSTGTSIRGLIGLIQQGTNLIVGTAELVDSLPKLSNQEMLAHFDKHRINAADIDSGETWRWRYPWVLKNASTLVPSTRFKFKSGAVRWVHVEPA